ncbi:hypothetical protein DUW70_17630 [Stenotrophomonas maltophilia]|nr:hypothetical protein DUW70_17630 [Stenotrophomonas maltophilia]
MPWCPGAGLRGRVLLVHAQRLHRPGRPSRTRPHAGSRATPAAGSGWVEPPASDRCLPPSDEPAPGGGCRRVRPCRPCQRRPGRPLPGRASPRAPFAGPVWPV